jgi:hypothetical protein
VKVRRVVVFSLTALILLTAVWVVGGNAWAAHREEQCDPAWTTEFGSLDDLKKKYPKRETNETAKLEILAKDLGLDLAPAGRTPGSVPRRLTPADEKRGQVINDYISVQISKPEASIDAPPEEISRFFEEKRVGLDAIELLLVAGPSPQWSFDLSESDRLPNGLGQIRLQRVLMARALTAARGGRSEAAARALEASWNLNESLRGRPETIPALLSIAIARLQVGTLRRVSVEEDRWRKRLAALDPRAALLDALVLEYRPASARCFWKHASTVGDPPSWYQRSRNFLMSPTDRLVMTDSSNLMRDELAKLQAAPLTDHFPEVPNSDVRDAAHIILAISMPNIHNSFLRADRLVVDAELTSKILEAKRLRRQNGGRWPAAIPGIEASRFPGASWRYEASSDGARMSIAFSRELDSPYWKGGSLKPLPLLFSSN